MRRNYYVETIDLNSSLKRESDVEQSDRFRAFCALRLESIGSTSQHNGEKLDFLNRFLSRQIDFIATVPSIGPDSALEIRLNSLPCEIAPHRGEIAIAIRIGSSGTTAKQCEKTLLSAIDCIYPSLVALSDAYQWRPINTEEEYNGMFHTIEPQHVSELVRREAMLPLDRLEALPSKRPLGFVHAADAFTERRPTKSEVYFVFPYIRTFSSLETLCNILMLDNEAVGISLAIKQTRLREQEIDALRRELERCEAFLGHVPHYGTDGSALGAPLTHRAQKLLDVLHDFTFSLLDDCFYIRTSVTSESPISAGIMEALGTTISESVSSKDPYSDASLATQNLKGGYEWMCADDSEQRRAASNNLRLLDFEPWIPSVAKPGAERLRYLADARQANSVFRLPIPVSGSFPGLHTRLARSAPPPKDLPEDGLCLGDNFYRGIQQPVNLLRDDRRRHMYVVGQTGTGKSSLLQQMVMQDIEGGEGVCLIDPHGELADDILGRIPAERIDDVVYIDPTDPNRTVGLNLLEFRDNIDRDSAINHLLEIFEQLYDMRTAGGPVFEQYLRNSALLATSSKESKATLADITRAFTDPQYRKERLEQCTDPLVRVFWKDVATKIRGEHALENLAAYVTSKFTRIVANSLMRQIVLQKESTVDFLDCMQNKKIVLIDLAKGRLGRTNSRFLGMVLLSLITRAAFARSEATGHGKELSDFYLYVDEFQNLATDSFATIFSEARKYRLNLIVSNQYLHQIPESLQDAVIGNAGTILSFRTGMQDAKMLEMRFSGGVGQHDLMALENYRAYLVTLIEGNATAVFDLDTREPVPVQNPHILRSVTLASARKHTRPRSIVEKSIAADLSRRE